MSTSSGAGGGRSGWGLSAYAQLAEIIASLAVLVTLMFLVGEVRRNTEVTRTSFYAETLGELNDWRMSLAVDPELSRAFWAYTSGDPVTDDPSLDGRLQLILNVQWGIYEKAFFAQGRGLLGEAEWGRFQTQICGAYGAAGVRWQRPAGIRITLTEDFVAFTEASCSR